MLLISQSHLPLSPVPSFLPPSPLHLKTFTVAVLTGTPCPQVSSWFTPWFPPVFCSTVPYQPSPSWSASIKDQPPPSLCPLTLLYYPTEYLSSMWLLHICLFSISLGLHLSFRRKTALLVLFTNESPVPRVAQCPAQDMHLTIFAQQNYYSSSQYRRTLISLPHFSLHLWCTQLPLLSSSQISLHMICTIYSPSAPSFQIYSLPHFMLWEAEPRRLPPLGSLTS